MRHKFTKLTRSIVVTLIPHENCSRSSENNSLLADVNCSGKTWDYYGEFISSTNIINSQFSTICFSWWKIYFYFLLLGIYSSVGFGIPLSKTKIHSWSLMNHLEESVFQFYLILILLFRLPFYGKLIILLLTYYYHVSVNPWTQNCWSIFIRRKSPHGLPLYCIGVAVYVHCSLHYIISPCQVWRWRLAHTSLSAALIDVIGISK